MNTHTINELYHLISTSNLDNVFTKVNNYLFVNLDWLTNRDYQFEGVNEYLFYIGQHKNKSIVFLQRDGVNLRFTGMLEIVKQTIQDLKLTNASCFLYGYNDPEIENCTFVPLNVVRMWASQCYPLIKDLPLSTNDYAKKFAGLFGRFDMYRLNLYKHLSKHDSLLGWNSKHVSFNSRHYEYFKSDQEWFNSYGTTQLDYSTGSGSVSFRDSLGAIGKHYNTYFIEVVSETDVHNNRFFTEKTLKNFYLGKPFLLLNGSGSLDYLRSFGFQTFAPYINESYDTMTSVYDRITAIKQEVDRLADLDYNTCRQINENLRPIFEHNRSIFEYIVTDKK